MDFDFKDVVVCIGGFTFGPFAAAIISILVAFIEMLTISHTGPIGFIMNVLATCCLLLHRLLHLQEGPFQEGRGPGPGLRRGVPGRGDAAVELPHHPPVYDRLFPGRRGRLLPTLFLPFNLAKGGMNMAATLLLYPPVVSAMRRAGVVPSSQSTQEKRINAGFVLFALSLLATFVVFALVLAGVI